MKLYASASTAVGKNSDVFWDNFSNDKNKTVSAALSDLLFRISRKTCSEKIEIFEIQFDENELKQEMLSDENYIDIQTAPGEKLFGLLQWYDVHMDFETVLQAAPKNDKVKLKTIAVLWVSDEDTRNFIKNEFQRDEDSIAFTDR